MGTDIHVVCETQHNGKWYPEVREELGVNRNYRLFDELVPGIRCRHDGLGCELNPKGWPEGVHEWTKEALEDYHSISWISMEDALDVEETLAIDWWHLVRHFKALHWTVDGVRFVVGFDN
jgi:hypothetical protein